MNERKKERKRKILDNDAYMLAISPCTSDVMPDSLFRFLLLLLSIGGEKSMFNCLTSSQHGQLCKREK